MSDVVVGLTLNFRDVPRTIRCVRTLLRDGVDKVWICDNSEDNGNSVLALHEVYEHDSRVTVVENPINLGFAAGVNRTLERIRRQSPKALVLIINNDACVLPGGLSLMREALDNNPEAILAYPAVLHGKGILSFHYYQRWLGLITEFPLRGSFSYPSGCAILLRLEKVQFPFLDEDFFMYGEDTLLGWRFRNHDAMVFVPYVCVEHEGSASSGIGSPFYETRIVAAHWILARKLSRNYVELCVMYGGRLITLSARVVLRALRYRTYIPLKAFYRGWRLVFNYDPLRDRVRRASSFFDARLRHFGTQ